MKNKKITILGDHLIDSYVELNLERISSEAPVLIGEKKKTFQIDGGAGNIYQNIKSLFGQDYEKCLNYYFKTLSHKLRYIDQKTKQQLLRVDNDRFYIKKHYKFLEDIKKLNKVDDTDILVIGDYCKGTIIEETINTIKFHPRINIVSTKKNDANSCSSQSIYITDILIVNELEYSKLKHYHDFDYLIVTKGSRGLELIKTKNNSFEIMKNIPANKVNVWDVSGAGDCITACIAYGLYLTDFSEDLLLRSCHFANDCASKVIQRFGTSPIREKEGIKIYQKYFI